MADHDVTVLGSTPDAEVTISMTLDALLARMRTRALVTKPQDVSVKLVSEEVAAPLHKEPPLERRVHPGPRGAAGSIMQYTKYGLESVPITRYCPLAHVGHLLKMSAHDVAVGVHGLVKNGDTVVACTVLLAARKLKPLAVHVQPVGTLVPTLLAGHGSGVQLPWT
jgi:hypothetical protein